ncbi:MAG: gliding motility-associated protein GldE [Muribaculaceae bacterium]|nr:gliding motility-associated protein GldE [Muribaculaceae bacterium]MDE7080921.1 gliding motility-associated protein GldE [Muribaculaceae bacterium]
MAVRAIEFHAPDNWGSWIIIVAIAAVCLMVSAFVSGSEIAYFGLTRAQITELEESDTPVARRALGLVNDSERLLATILISNNLVNITMVVLLTFAINQAVTFNSELLNFLLQTVFLTFLLLLCGEIFPKLVARSNTMKWVLAATGGLGALCRIFSPLARLMVKSSAIINRVVTKQQEDISTDVLEKALSISDIKEGQEKDMLEGILNFGEKEVSEIMISRVDVTDVEYHETWDNVIKVILESGYSRIPVYDTSQDTIRGILYSKDLLPYIGNRDNSFRWQSLIREAFFVPESRKIDDLLEDFRKRRIHMAIVIDEYGCTQGIVALEDIIEEIVGEIDDEYDDTATMYTRVAPGTYIMDGKISIGDLCRVLDIEEDDLGDVGDAETLAGLMLEIKGDFPESREVLHRGPLALQALKLEKHRITKVKVTVEHTSNQQENGD